MICYLVRHGKDDHSIRGGWSQHPLMDEGIVQAQRLADYIERNNETLAVKYLCSSDLLRAMQTAEPIAEKLKIPVIPLPQFREVNNGVLAGMKNDLALEMYPGLFWNCLGWEEKYPGGENPRDFYERIAAAWDAFGKEILTQDENVLLVTHGGVIHVILSIINQETYCNMRPPRQIGNTEMISIENVNGKWMEVK